MEIKYANKNDLILINKHDNHISKENLFKAINEKRVIIIKKDNHFCGWLRYNLFWDKKVSYANFRVHL